ncbi:hypothetical protein EZV62_007231 [Acer yangbiense]|uniref:Uncharacterized protein n=1 Tax=Acer yangbiense TaxID=1000413 RepID=A0A5C7IBY9_9ROSI|nr:hypothetical protein EZV62_007231 [Acer yangbiense]
MKRISILGSIPADLKEKGSTFYASLIDGKKAFVFSAQQSPPEIVSPNLSNCVETSGSAKRARAELTSYGRSDVVANSNFKGKSGRIGSANQGATGSMGGAGKNVTSCSLKKTSGAAIEVNPEKFMPVKKWVKKNPAIVHQTSSIGIGSGSRFDVLGDEGTDMGNMKSRSKGKVVASSIRSVAKLDEPRGVSFLAKLPRNNILCKAAGDDEDLDSASVLR